MVYNSRATACGPVFAKIEETGRRLCVLLPALARRGLVAVARPRAQGAASLSVGGQKSHVTLIA